MMMSLLSRSRGAVSFLSLIAITLGSASAFAQSRLEKVMGDKSKFEAEGLWYYNDLEKAFDAAKKNGQPVLVVLRCIPCHECVKLDDELVESNPVVQQLLKSFVRVRIVTTNGLDLSLFQFDTDQSFSVFIFNADRTLYGRYGTRSDQTKWEDDVSIEGLARAMEASLQIHRDYPKNRDGLMGKQARTPEFASPEKIPAFAAKYKDKLDYDGNVVQSCIHCHMIGEGIREHYLASTGKIPDESLFPYPHPKILGLILDPAQCASIKHVVPGSIAEQSGFQAGDRLESMNGQLLTSMADVQWVLHGIPMAGGDVLTKFRRGNNAMESTIPLPQNWRKADTIEWRASSWQLRKFGLGGMVIKTSTAEERKSALVKDEDMAYTVQHVGAYAPHDRAKKAGVQKGDILISADGRKDFKSPSAVLEYSINVVPAGESITMELVRNGQVITAKVPTATR